MRVVSLLPACTEWTAAFGAVEYLVGRSHDCDHPPDAGKVPVLTRPAVAIEGAVAKDIDSAVREHARRGLSLFDVDLERLAALRPDLILTQTTCKVCAVPLSQITADLTEHLDAPADIFSYDPETLKQVFSHAMRLGRRLGRMKEAITFLAEGERRLKLLQDRIGISKSTPIAVRPSVLCIEWMDPVMASGNWVPDLVELAGGSAVCCESGQPSTYIGWGDIVEADPDVIAVMPCGYPITRTLAEFAVLSGREGWRELSAVREGRVYIFDGQAYFNRPGPRLYRSVELLAEAIHGRRAGVAPEEWEVERLTDAQRPAG